ncbi:MAG: XisI protein [Chloroflexia bacterium]
MRTYAQLPSHGEIEVATIFDDESDHYQLVLFGWNLGSRIHAVIPHLRLHDGKVWIEQDGTAEGIATDLLEAGIPREEIVLAFHSPWKRQFTEFAVA